MRATLFCANPYAFGILKPLNDELLNEGHSVLWFVPQKHLSSFPFQVEVAFTTSISDVFYFSSDAIFVPGNEVPHYLPGVKVQVFHGMAGEKRGHFRIRHYFDLYLTQGPYFTSRFEKLALKHNNFFVKETGWCKLDPLYQNTEQFSKQRDELLKKNNKKHLVLYAPTFSPSLTSAIALKDEVFRLAQDEDILLLIKFHDLMDRRIAAQYEDEVQKNSNVKIVKERNILSTLKMAHVMISDTSSVVYEFTFLNKPVITLNSRSPHIVWNNITEPRQLPTAFSYTITNDIFAEKRAELIRTYHPYTDGRSSHRMIKAVENHIRKHGVPVKRKLNLYRKYKMLKDFGPKPK
ncbi:MAG TPA: CDP-glycerol--glycerophosphate glycerophosphotransferase [Bacteroidetes bacterium]|nr:CDP-glycerol--glycerophosphate glycerophosphotransferase [Bacteroidota bacterium]